MAIDSIAVTETILEPEGHTYVQWTIAILVTLSVLTYGMQIGWVSPVATLLKSDQSPTGKALTENEISWIASLPPLLSAFCSSPYSWCVDRYGRRFGIMTIGVFQAVCWALKLSADPTCLIISRVFCGIAAAGCFNIVPMYIKEISQDNIRGVLGFLVMMLQNLGVLAMYLMGAYLEYYLVLWIMLPIPIVVVLMMFMAPESPVYLVKTGRHEDAASTIAYLRGMEVTSKSVQSEMENIQREDEVFKSIPNVNILTIFKKRAWRNGFIVMFVLMSLRGFNGGMAIIMYASSILQQSGVTVDPELMSVFFPTFMILGCFMAMSCVERFGRKIILMLASLVSVASFAALGCIVVVQASASGAGTVPPWAPMSVIVAAEFAFAAGVSPLPFIIMAEMFNFQIRAKVMGVLSSVTWATTFAQLMVMEPVSSAFGPHVSFFAFALVNLLAVTTVFFLPETKGKNIEQIENALEGNKGKSEVAAAL